MMKKQISGSAAMAILKPLREVYSKIDTVDPDSDAYKSLTSYLDRLDTKILELISVSRIKFVSALARNRVNRRAMK